MMYVVGGVDENEIMLYNVVLALRDSLHLLFKYAPSQNHYFTHQTIGVYRIKRLIILQTIRGQTNDNRKLRPSFPRY